MTERSVVALARLSVRAVRGRIVLLGVFSAIFLAAALTARAVAGHGEHIEPDALFELGGFPLVSAVLLLGWSIGRFPVLAILVLAAGLFSADHASGMVRVYGARRISLVHVYLVRLVVLALVAFLLSAVLMPLFDVILLGRWAGSATLVLIVAYITAYGGLVAFLSVFTRADAWIALALGISSLVWAVLRGTGVLTNVPGVLRDMVTFALPPQDAFFALESAFAEVAPIPWGAFAYAIGYGLVFLVLGGILLANREI